MKTYQHRSDFDYTRSRKRYVATSSQIITQVHQNWQVFLHVLFEMHFKNSPSNEFKV